MTRRRVLLPLAAFAAACRRGASKVVGVVPKGSTHTFWQAVRAGAVKAARESGLEVQWNAPAQEGDRSRQIAIVESMINQRLAGIALAPVDRTALSAVVDRAAGAGIPVVIFDSGIDTPRRISYIATDNREGGRMAARRMARVLGGHGKAAIISDTPGSASTTERIEGFQGEMRAHHSRIEVLPVQFCYADRAKARALMENLLTAHPDLAGIFADHENAASGASLAVRARQQRSLKLVAFDVSEQLVENLKEGWIDSLLVQNPFRMGYESLRAIALKLAGGIPAPSIDTGITLVLRDMLNRPEIAKLVSPEPGH